MKGTLHRIVSTGMCLVLLAATSALAAPKQLEIGTKAPEFKLPGVDGKELSLKQLFEEKKKKAVVVAFTCNHCPVAIAYQDRLIALQKAYKDKGVQVVAINPNSTKIVPGDSLEKMKERAKEKNYNFPYLRDESQEVARAYKATCTPHVFLVNQEGKVVYRGAIDDSQNPKKVEKHYLSNAIDATLKGEKVETAETKQFGCSIKWDKKE
jgi:peroxiredoxin